MLRISRIVLLLTLIVSAAAFGETAGKVSFPY